MLVDLRRRGGIILWAWARQGVIFPERRGRRVGANALVAWTTRVATMLIEGSVDQYKVTEEYERVCEAFTFLEAS